MLENDKEIDEVIKWTCKMEGNLEKYGQPLENGGRFREIWPTLRKTSETTKRVTNH